MQTSFISKLVYVHKFILIYWSCIYVPVVMIVVDHLLVHLESSLQVEVAVLEML